MPVCPYGNHRLRVTREGNCQRCGNDLSLYAGAQGMAIACFNEARGLWDAGDLRSAAAWLRMALYADQSLPEVYWLLAAIYARTGSHDLARASLERAQSLGAAVDPEWVAPVRQSASAPPIPGAPAPAAEES